MDGDLRCGHRLGFKDYPRNYRCQHYQHEQSTAHGAEYSRRFKNRGLDRREFPKARRLRRGQRIRFTMSRTESWPPWLPGAIEPIQASFLYSCSS
jgi:hypothetical protein